MEHGLLTDELLANLLKSGDKPAFREIYDRYWKLLYLTAVKKTGLAHIAEELVQNVFVSLWTNREKADIKNIAGYLHAAVRYQVISHIASSATARKHSAQISFFTPSQEPGCENRVLVQELSRAINRAISILPQKSQTIFRLSRLEGCGVKDISHQMNMSEKAVEYHITKSLKLMKLYLKEFRDESAGRSANPDRMPAARVPAF